MTGLLVLQKSGSTALAVACLPAWAGVDAITATVPAALAHLPTTGPVHPPRLAPVITRSATHPMARAPDVASTLQLPVPRRPHIAWRQWGNPLMARGRRRPDPHMDRHLRLCGQRARTQHAGHGQADAESPCILLHRWASPDRCWLDRSIGQAVCQSQTQCTAPPLTFTSAWVANAVCTAMRMPLICVSSDRLGRAVCRAASSGVVGT